MKLVIVGHVDHGKSTLVGRLMADTDSLPTGKLDFIKDICDQQGKTFEFAFLLDALEEEQTQGITIDTARTFFNWKNREYIIIDAPGHKEFLKNMISGAARADAAILVIDAAEGIRQQSRQQVLVKDLVDEVFTCLCRDFAKDRIHVTRRVGDVRVLAREYGS